MARRRTSPRGARLVPRETIDRVLSLVRQGWTLAAVAEEMGYATSNSLSRWRTAYPDFAVELDRAKAEGASLSKRAARRERVLSRVRAGEMPGAAAKAEGLCHEAPTRWARIDADFRVRYHAAKAAGERVRYGALLDRRKAALLTAIAAGRTVTEACRLTGEGTRNPRRWCKADPGFAAEYGRLVGETRYPAARRKLLRVVGRVRAGATVWQAAKAEGASVVTVLRWRDCYPAARAAILAAYADTGREPPPTWRSSRADADWRAA